MTLFNFAGIVFSILSSIFILAMIRKNKIKEKYVLLWFLFLITIILICSFFDSFVKLTQLLGFQVPSNGLFFFGIIGAYCLICSITVIISGIAEKQKVTIQKLALLEAYLEEKIESKR